MTVGLPEWPEPSLYPDWKEWSRALIGCLNEQLLEDYSEVGMVVEFAVSLPQNGRWLEANGGTFLSASYPELAQKLGTTFTPAPPAGSTRLPNRTPAANHKAGIRAL